MKKILALTLALCMLFALAACGSQAASSGGGASSKTAADPDKSDAAAEKTLTVGVCQLVQHPALDAATQGFVDTLKARLGDKVTITVLNGAGDQASCATIANQFVSDGVDLIMANATPALIACAAATNEIPILGTSITEYGAAFELDAWKGRSIALNVSGTSDLAPLDGQAEIIKELFPDAKTVGILFCSAEANSKFQVDTITPILEGMGFKVVPYAFADSNDVASVAANACGDCDVLYIPTDNTAASCAEAINNVAQPAGIPIVCGEENLCAGCGVATLSISYYDLGCATAEMAVKILTEGADVSTMDIQYAPQFTKEFNADLCAALNLAIPDGYSPIGG